MESAAMIETIVQLATATGFAGLTWYLIVYRIPEMQRQFFDALERQQERFTGLIEANRIAQAESHRAAEQMARDFLASLTRIEEHMRNARPR